MRPDLSEVARIYREAAECRQPPTQAVQEWWGVSHSAATKWVAGARKEGLLPPTTAGKASIHHGYSEKLMKVSDALGIDPWYLAEAIREHANGDLRIGGVTP